MFISFYISFFSTKTQGEMKFHFLFSACLLACSFFLYSSAAPIALNSTAIVNSLNDARSKAYPTPAKALKSLSWSSKLATYAANNVNTCNFTTVNRYSLYRTQTNALRSIDFNAVIELWSYERVVLNWNLANLAKARNYTAMMWENSTLVGCAANNCPGLGAWYQCFFSSTRGNYAGK